MNNSDMIKLIALHFTKNKVEVLVDSLGQLSSLVKMVEKLIENPNQDVCLILEVILS